MLAIHGYLIIIVDYTYNILILKILSGMACKVRPSAISDCDERVAKKAWMKMPN